MSPDDLTAAFFGAVSFAPGERPDYGAIRALFLPGGRLIRAIGDTLDVTTVDEFIAPRQALVDRGALTAFEEYEIEARIEAFGNVVHRFSIYGKRGTQDGASFEARGAISTQFVNTADGWRIASMAWDDERPGLTLPAG